MSRRLSLGAAACVALVLAVPWARDRAEDLGGEALGWLEVWGLRMPDWHPYQREVTATLTRGSRVDAAGVAALRRRGFQGIVNLTRENDEDEAAARALGMAFLRVPLIDNTAPTDAQMKIFLDFVTTRAHQPTYVHCEAGIGRTGVAVAVYRMAVQGWSADRALAEANEDVSVLPCQRIYLEGFARRLAQGAIAGYPLRPSSDASKKPQAASSTPNR